MNSHEIKSPPGRIALRRRRNMPQKRPAAGGESGRAGFIVLRRPAHGSLLQTRHAGRAADRGKRFPCPIVSDYSIEFTSFVRWETFLAELFL